MFGRKRNQFASGFSGAAAISEYPKNEQSQLSCFQLNYRAVCFSREKRRRKKWKQIAASLFIE
jgi:hypothetical protein